MQSKQRECNNMKNENIKRVATLYRVSTKKQMDDDDIPMQRNSCLEFIAKKDGWSFSKDYIEKGVSAYKVSADDREDLQDVIRDAIKGEFDILLVYSNDRLGRISDEYTPTLRKLSKYVEVWSVMQGDITVRSHSDVVKTFIDGWQNEGESLKISARTDEKHRQMVEANIYRGGSPPYGYDLALSGQFSERDKKKRKELYTLVINEVEADMVRLIFSLLLEKGWGGSQIAQYLNKLNAEKEESQRVLTKTGKAWNSSTINNMFRNPIYKGCQSYGKNSQKKDSTGRKNEDEWVVASKANENWVIISEVEWEKVQKIRQARKPFDPGIYEYKPSSPTKGKFFLWGSLNAVHAENHWLHRISVRRTHVKTELSMLCQN